MILDYGSELCWFGERPEDTGVKKSRESMWIWALSHDQGDNQAPFFYRLKKNKNQIAPWT